MYLAEEISQTTSLEAVQKAGAKSGRFMGMWVDSHLSTSVGTC